MKTTTGGRPEHLGLCWIQLQSVGTDPCPHIINARRQGHREVRRRMWTAVAVYLRIVRVEVAAKTVALDHTRQVSGIQQC